jgi:hypothetical protein
MFQPAFEAEGIYFLISILHDKRKKNFCVKSYSFEIC